MSRIITQTVHLKDGTKAIVVDQDLAEPGTMVCYVKNRGKTSKKKGKHRAPNTYSTLPISG